MMSLDTTKSIKSITYNGTEIPLAGGSSSSSSKITHVAISNDSDNYEIPIGIMYQIGENEYEFSNDYASTDSVINLNVLVGGMIFIFIDPMEELNISCHSKQNITDYTVPNTSSYASNYYSIFKVTDEEASFVLHIISATTAT